MSAINPDLGPDPVRRLTDGSTRRRPVSRPELHAIFREAARWELTRNGLSGWRRRRLVQYAAALRISAVDAGRLIQEAADAADAERLGRVPQSAPPQPHPDAAGRWPSWGKLALGLALVLAVKLILDWLLGG